MQSHLLPYQSSLFHYQKAGSGKVLLFCLHGYGEDCGSFEGLAESVDQAFTLICLDLPHHGQTIWEPDLSFSPEDLAAVLDLILERHQLQLALLQLVGYSMGARVILGLLPRIGVPVKKILLIAPDGLRTSRWYFIATQTWLGSLIFKSLMHNPSQLVNLVGLAGRMGWLNRSISKFALSYLQDPQARMDLYRRWMTLRKFRCAKKEIKQLIRTRRIRVDLVFGEFDRMISYRSGELFRKHIESHCHLTVLPAGHQILQERNLDALKQLL